MQQYSTHQVCGYDVYASKKTWDELNAQRDDASGEEINRLITCCEEQQKINKIYTQQLEQVLDIYKRDLPE